MAYRLANLNVLVAEQHDLTADLGINIESGPSSTTRYLSNQLSPLIAENRTLSSLLDILTDLGVQVSLDVLIVGQYDVSSNLQVYIKSEQLRVGASASYNPDGDEVESILFIEDGDILHPELIESMTATLVYRGRHVLGTVGFNKENGSADGTVTTMWIHPAHREELSIRYEGTIANLGEVDFLIEVNPEGEQDVPLDENILEGVDIEAPRTEPSTNAAHRQVLDPAPEEVETLAPEVVFTLLRINLLSQYDYMEIGEGSLDYSGGGNRLLTSLSNDGTFLLQAKNQLAVELGAHTRLEVPGTNLLTNSNFQTPTSGDNSVPQGWGLSAASTITTIPELDTSEDAGVLKIRCWGSGPYVGPKAITLAHQSPVTLSSLDPLVFSVMARTEAGNDDVVVKTLKLTVSFRDSVDVELSSQTSEFDPMEIEGTTFALLHLTATPPPGTTSARVSISMESIEASDEISLFLMAPQLELGDTPTSRVIGSSAPVNRTGDMLRIRQANHIEFRRGSIAIIFAPDYDGVPSDDSCLFDTRDDAGLNGFAAYHLTSGKIRFVVGGPVTPMVLDSNQGFDFQAGIFQNVVVSWAGEFRQIQHNNEIVAQDGTAVVLPQAFNEWIYFFQTAAGADQFNGELASFEIRRDVEQ